MTDKNQTSPLTAPFDAKRAIDFARSELFERTFKEGMAMVEETAAYLDGPGRAASKRLSRAAALAYAGESMRLTTRLMQVASWLLVHRAVRDGEMTLSQASKEKKKVRLVSAEPVDQKTLAILPAKLADLISRSRTLQDKVRRLDATIHAPVPDQPSGVNPLDRHLGLLKAAFERTEA